jgi:uncharacterized protein with PQ loop repeat
MARKTHAKHTLMKKEKKTFLDYAVYVFSVATPLFELPQAYIIYVHHDAQNISVYTWGFFLIDNIVWIIYAIRYKSMPLLITSVLYLLIEVSIVVGIFIYA